MQRTAANKHKAVPGMLADFADWSDRAIAKHVGVDGKTVGAQREAVCGSSSDSPTTRTIERNGKTYTQDTAGQKKAGKERATAASAVAQVESDSTPGAGAAPPEADSDSTAVPAAPPPDERDTRIAALAEQVAELSQSLTETVADTEAMSKVFDADEKLAKAMAENKQRRAEVSTLRERVNGLLNEKNEAIFLVKAWRRKAEK